jgi:hypothetical protein
MTIGEPFAILGCTILVENSDIGCTLRHFYVNRKGRCGLDEAFLGFDPVSACCEPEKERLEKTGIDKGLLPSLHVLYSTKVVTCGLFF